MEEDDVALLHLQVNPVVFELLVLLNAEVGLVDLSVVRVLMIVEATLVGFGKDVQTAIFRVAVLESRPSSHYPFGRSKWKICQILVEWMSRA